MSDTDADDDSFPSDSADPDEEAGSNAAPIAVDPMLKSDLLSVVAPLNRGFAAREDERALVLALVEQLEASQATQQGACADFGTPSGSVAAGEWKLVFTTALDVLAIGVNPLVEVGQIYQNIADDGEEVVNVIEIQPKIAALANPLVGSSLSTLRVFARAVVEDDRRIRIAFKRIEAEAISIFGFDLTTFLPPQLQMIGIDIPSAVRGDGGDPAQSQGYFTVTFCDGDLRVSRSNSGDLFVLVRA